MLARIRLRLTAGYVGILAVILVLFGAVVAVGFWQLTVRQQDSMLVKKAEELIRAAREGQPLGDVTMDDSNEYAWAAFEPDGTLLGRDSTAPSFGLPLPEHDRGIETASGPDGADIRVATVAARDGSGTVVYSVQMARTLAVDRATLNRLLYVLLPIGAGSLALAALGGLFMSRRAMRPVADAFARQRTFVADASHELKTPLALARMDAEVLQRDPAVSDAPTILAHQVAELDRMGALLGDLLTLARLDAGKLVMRREPFDLAAVLAETADRFRARAADRGVTVELRPNGALAACGDADRTAQILAALVDNAVCHTSEGGTVVLAGRLSGSRVQATVSDTGEGIDPDRLPRVFDRFYRAEEARTRVASGGTGLGLAIARELARAQGGDLTAANAGAGGAIIRLELGGPQPKGDCPL